MPMSGHAQKKIVLVRKGAHDISQEIAQYFLDCGYQINSDPQMQLVKLYQFMDWQPDILTDRALTVRNGRSNLALSLGYVRTR